MRRLRRSFGHDENPKLPHFVFVVTIYFPHEPFDSVSEDGLAQPFWNDKADLAFIGLDEETFDYLAIPAFSPFENAAKIQRFSQYLIFGKPEIMMDQNGLDSIMERL